MYKIRQTTNQMVSGRKTITLFLVFDGTDYLVEDFEDYLTMVALEKLSDVQANAIIIFAASSEEKFKYRNFDLGRVLLTSDGRGWIGDGKALDGRTPDRAGVADFEPSATGEHTFIQIFPSGKAMDNES